MQRGQTGASETGWAAAAECRRGTRPQAPRKRPGPSRRRRQVGRVRRLLTSTGRKCFPGQS